MQSIKQIITRLIETMYRSRKVLLVLSCLVVFIVTYVLILPAFTLEKDEAEELGGIDVPGVEQAADAEAALDVDLDETVANDVRETKPEKGAKNQRQSRKDSPITLQNEENEDYSVAIEGDQTVLSEDMSVNVREIDQSTKNLKKEYNSLYSDALEAVQKAQKEEGLDQPSDFASAKFYDISIMDGEAEVEPGAAVDVRISFGKALQKELKVTDPERVYIVHFAEDKETGEVTPEVLDAENTDITIKKNNITDVAFTADSFSVYGVITVPSAQPDPDISNLDGKPFTISRDSRYMTTSIVPIDNQNNTNGFGKTGSARQAAVWYFEKPAGSSGNTYYIYTLNDNNEKQYINLTKNNDDRANASLSGNPQIFTVTRDGNSYRLATQSNDTTYYLDEHNGDRGNAFAGWRGANDNGKLTLNFSNQPVMQDNGQYMALVKHNGKYYIVNNDGSLTEVEYDEATKKVKVDDPMLWTINKNNPNGHIYFNSAEAGFNNLQTASDWYRRYLDPTSESGWLEETNKSGPGHVDIDEGDQHYAENAGWYWEHHITDRSIVENKTTVSIDNTSTGDSTLYNIYHGDKNGSNYLGVVTNTDGSLRLAGRQSGDNAAEFVFASPTEVKSVDWVNHTVDHIDISIAGTASVSVPLAYGKYYGSTAGDAEAPVLTVSDNIKIELSEEQMVDREQLRITAEDMKGATITAARADNGQPIDDAFYITGYSGNVANGTSNDQVRIEGSFLVADLRDTEYEHVNTFYYQNFHTWDMYNPNDYTRNVNQARKNNTVEYTVTVVKPLTYNLIDPELGQLYDADGEPLTVTVDVAFSASFNYWDSRNECPAVNGKTGFGGAAWTNGGIDPSNISGMDFVLGGNAEDPNSPLTALEITKVIMDEEGNRIELKDPVVNYFDIYEKKDATNDQKNGVAGLHVVDSLNHPEWQADPRDAAIRDGYEFWRTKRVTVDESGSAIVFDFDASDAMYYIVEKHDDESLPDTIMDKDGNEYAYDKTYFETEYVRRDNEEGTHDEYSNKSLHPHAMHITEEYTRDSTGGYAYASIPEVAGKFTKLDGIQKKEGFLEFYVYNIYRPIQTETDITLKKVDVDHLNDASPDLLKGASFTITKYSDEDFRDKDTTWGTAGSKTVSDDKKSNGTYTLNGMFDFQGLSAGYYQIDEVNCPDGYIKIADSLRFKVEENANRELEVSLLGDSTDQMHLEDDKLTIRIGNTPGAELPHTGGIGTTIFYILGSLLVVGSAVVLISRRRIRK